MGDLKVAFIRISFEPGDYPGFTGNGNYEFVQNAICGDYTIDPAPHDKNYFQSHVKAVNNYFRTVSYGKFGFDMKNSVVLPNENEGSYIIQKPMNYYNELGNENEHEKRITELLRDAIQVAVDEDQIDFSQYDLVAIIHPGVGQDFKLPFLDPTPEDIPSTFVDKNMVNTHLDGPIQIGNASIPMGIILPESQNHILMDDAIHDALNNPCNVQFSITGTWALMVGFAVGLPPLWDLETGLSGVGVFSLMDQGSNNGHGIVPAPPNAWTRIFAGWEEATTFQYPGKISIQSGIQNSIAKVPIGADEYFLIENRNNWFRDGVNIDSSRYAVWEKMNHYPSFINVLLDSAGVKKNEYGVITNIPNYDLGLPASGLLIWHIDEKKIQEGLGSFSVNADRKQRGIDLEEADGAQDIGYITNLFTDPSSGYWGDMWFGENKEYFRANADGSMDFSSFTHPNTKSNSGANSGINISNISKAGENMSFTLSSSYDMAFLKDENKSILFQWDVDGDGDLDFVGGGDSIWYSLNGLLNPISIIENKWKETEVFIPYDSENDLYNGENDLVIVGVNGFETDVLWFTYNHNSKRFVNKWKYFFINECNVGFIRAFKFANEVRFNYNGFDYNVFPDKITKYTKTSNSYSRCDPPHIGLSGNQSDGTTVYSYRRNIIFNSPTLIEHSGLIDAGIVDIDLDGRVDIVLVDSLGAIFGYDNNIILKSGFPITANAVPPILLADLFDDNHPELIFQDSNGNIKILDYEGNSIQRFSMINGDKLKMIGEYDGMKSIVTEKTIYQLSVLKDYGGNEWIHPDGGPNRRREIKLKIPVDSTGQKELLLNEFTYAYPNPSYGEDVIFRIRLGIAETIEINIFDISGFPIKKLSKTLVAEVDNPRSWWRESFKNNDHELKWNVSNIESGVYLARVIVSGEGKSEEKIIKVGVIK